MKKIVFDKRLCICLISCFVFGLICHGYCLFNKLSIGDDIQCIKSFGSTYSFGRWMLGLVEKASAIFSITNYSIPLFNGLLVILYISLSVYLIVVGINITESVQIIILSGIMVSFPTVTSSFGYLFTSPSYFFGVLISTIGCFVFYKNKNLFSILFCCLLMSCSVGIYQANIPVCISLLLIFMAKDVIDNDYDVKSYCILAIQNIVICLGFICLYYIFNKLFLELFNIQLTSYKGLNNFGITSLQGYFYRILNAYIQFVNPNSHSEYANMFPGICSYVYILLVATTAFLMIIISLKNKVLKNIEVLIVFAFIPLASYFIFVMVEDGEIHSLMTYGYVFVIISMLIVINYYHEQYSQIVNIAYYVLLTFLIVSYARLSNVCYLKTAIIQENSINYFNRLASRIENTNGYNSSIPVVYINENKKNAGGGFSNSELFEKSYLVPYRFFNDTKAINHSRWRMAMNLWTGFNPVVKNDESVGNTPVTIDMPCYPDDGSIRIIDGIIYVKFADD